MYEEPWMEAQRAEERWDRLLMRRPGCVLCGEPIAEEQCLDLGGEYVCPGCIRLRMVETEAL